MLVHFVYDPFAPNMFGRMMKYALRCSKCHQYCKAPTFKPKSHITFDKIYMYCENTDLFVIFTE